MKEWFDNSLLSRLNDKQNGVIIIVMQRLHQDDLVGHVLEQDGGWEVVKFPAIAEDDETFTIDDIWGRRTFERRTGDALYAEREPIQLLKRIRADIGEYNFSSQYQQNPIPPGGAMVKLNWLRSYDPNVTLPEFTHILQSWDTANKAGELNDYSVCTTWGFRDRKDCYLLDVYRKRVDFPNLKRALIEYARKYEPHTILVEDKASGTQLIQDLKFEGIFNIVPYEPAAGTDKVVRLHTQTPVFESGHVFLPSEASWRADYITELAAFPGSKYDDQVDSTTQALQYLTSVLRQLSIYDFL